MRRVFGVKQEKTPAPSLDETTEGINKRGDVIDEKIRKLDIELTKYRDQIKRTRPGPALEAVKARAMRVLKQKKMYEGQRDNLYQQTYNLEQVSFAQSGLKDAQTTMTAMKAAGKELKSTYKNMRVEDVEKLQDDMMDLTDMGNEIQDAMGRSYGVPDDVDEEELMGELDALETEMEGEVDATPSYLQAELEPVAEAPDPFGGLPSAPTAQPQAATPEGAQVDEFGFPAIPVQRLRV